MRSGSMSSGVNPNTMPINRIPYCNNNLSNRYNIQDNNTQMQKQHRHHPMRNVSASVFDLNQSGNNRNSYPSGYCPQSMEHVIIILYYIFIQ